MEGAVVLAFPLLAAVGFGIVTFLDLAVLKGGHLLDRYGQFFYIGFLVVPLLAAWLATASEGGVPGMFAVEVGRPFWWVPLWLVLAAGLGTALFAGELWGTLVLRNLPGVGAVMSHPAVEGHTETVKQQVRQVAAPAAFALTAGSTVLIEEILWRGFLIDFLRDDWHQAAAVALVVSGVSFGLNHLYFGLRGFLFKSLHGIAWGTLFLVSGVLLAAVASHFVFNIWVWHKLRKDLNRDALVTSAA